MRGIFSSFRAACLCLAALLLAGAAWASGLEERSELAPGSQAKVSSLLTVGTSAMNTIAIWATSRP